MRHRQLLAIILSIVMVMTCFSVPVMADEIVEPVNTSKEHQKKHLMKSQTNWN